MRKVPPVSSPPTELIHGLNSHPPGTTCAEWRAGKGIWNINYTLSGTLREILPEGETWERPHDFMLLKPGGSHCWEVPRDAREPWRVIYFVFRPKPEWMPLLDLPEEFPHFTRLSLAGRKHDGKIRRSLLEAHRLASHPARNEPLVMNALERALLWLQADQSATRVRMDPRVQATTELFARQLANPPSIPVAAAACGLSPSRLGALFRAATGQSPQQWLEQARLNHARDLLLSTGLPVKLVAAAAGYDDQRHFATRFRGRFGLSPTDCRERGVR